MSKILSSNVKTFTIDDQIEKNKEIVTLPYNYVAQLAGKNFRSKLLLALNYWLKVCDDKLVLVTDIINMLHTASLIHDDIQDNSITRRGSPSAHTIFGIPLSLISGTYVLTLAIDLILTKFPTNLVPNAMEIVVDISTELHIGQGLDIYWRDNYICPTEDQYLYMVECKTGGLFKLGYKLLQLFSDNKLDFTPFLKLLSHFFQIRDDYANLKCDAYQISKGFAEDLSEGKYSFPIIHAILSKPHDIRIPSMLRSRNINDETKKCVLSLLNEFGSMRYTRDKMDSLENECRLNLSKFSDNPLMSNIVDILSVV